MSRRTGWRRRLIFAVPLALIALALSALSAFAATGPVGTAAGFEDNDGNLANDAADPVPFDWNDFSPVTYTGTAPYRVASKTASGWQFKAFEDDAVSPTDTGFAGGVKQDNDCGTTKGGKAPNKDDLKRIYLASKTVGGHVYLEIAWVRIPQNSVTASAHVGYEFNQGKFNSSGDLLTCGGSPNLALRKGGDMLIVYDFEGGSGPPAIKLSRWLKNGEPYVGQTVGAACEVNNSSSLAGCWGDTKILSASGFAEGLVNSFGSVVDNIKPSGATNPGTVEFGEAGIDLTAAGVFGATTCNAFGKAYAVSRSSGNSSQAAMEDIVGPGDFTLTNCGSVAVTKLGSDGGSQAGAVFTLYSGTGTGGTVIGTCTVQADGSCTATFVNLQPGTYTLDETTTPAGYNKDPSLPFTFTIAAGESKQVTFTDAAAPATVSVTKHDDAGAGVAGAVFTLYSPQGISNDAPTGSAVGNCTTDANGQCHITGITPGNYTIDESFVPSGYAKDATFPKNITLTNGQTLEVSATDPRQFKMIVLVCRQSDNTLYSSTVKINNDLRPASLTSAGASSAGLSESALCGLTAGAKGGLLRSGNDHSATVTIP